MDTRRVRRVAGISGQAIIEVDDDGANRIVVLSGANAELAAGDVLRGLEVLDPKIVLTQLESPLEVTEAVASWCSRNGRRFMVNPSPVVALPDEILSAADPLIVNEYEAGFYAGAGDSEALGRELLEVSNSAVITLGGAGVVVAEQGSVRRIPVDEVRVVDKTSAGDVFAGTLAAHVSQDATLLDASARAAAAATQFVGRPRRS